MAQAEGIETEAVQDAAIEVAAVEEADPEARYRYDDSLLERVKGKVKRPTKPDEQERNLQIEKLRASQQQYSARIAEIKEIEAAARASRTGSSAANSEIHGRIKSLKNEFQTVLRQKQHAREEMNEVIKVLTDLRTAQRTLRDRLPRGLTPETLEAKIAEVEYRCAHDPGDSSNEAALHKRLRELEQSRGPMREMADIEARQKPAEEARAQIRTRMDEYEVVLNNTKAAIDAEQRVLDERKASQQASLQDLPQLAVEKQECWDIIQALKVKMEEIRQAFNAKYQEYIKLDKNWNAYMRCVKRKEYEERQKAREERAAVERGEADPSNPDAQGGATDVVIVEAYAAEVFTIEQLVLYLRKLMPADTEAKPADGVEKKAVEVPQGMKLLKKNNEDENLFAVAKKKPQSKKGGDASSSAAKATSASSAPAEPPKKKLQHSLDTLKTFMQFSIEVPQTSAELSTTIENLEAKKAHFLELRKNPPAPVPKTVARAAEPPAAPDQQDKQATAATATAESQGADTAATESMPEPAAVAAEDFEAADGPVPEPEAAAEFEAAPEPDAPMPLSVSSAPKPETSTSAEKPAAHVPAAEEAVAAPAASSAHAVQAEPADSNGHSDQPELAGNADKEAAPAPTKEGLDVSLTVDKDSGVSLKLQVAEESA